MYEWLNDRLQIDNLYKKYLRKAFPVHPTFFLGEVALFSFVILILTGTYLAMIYQPSTASVSINGQQNPAAYLSVVHIDQIPFGLIMRQVHHMAAEVMIAAIMVHMARIFFQGAFKNPREINWLIGVGLFTITLFEAFLGYSLPFDAFSVTATGIGYQIARSVPWIGNWLAWLVFGGAFPTLGSIPRMFFMHVFLLPLVLLGMIGAHLLILIKQKHTQPEYAEKHAKKGLVIGTPLVPNQAMMSTALFLFILGGLMWTASLFSIHPVKEFGPPNGSTPNVKPEWYLAWLYGLLKTLPAIDFKALGTSWTSELVGGLVFPGIVFTFLAMTPFWKPLKERNEIIQNPWLHPVRMGWGMGMIAMFIVLIFAGFYNDLGMQKHVIQLIVVAVPLAVGLGSYYYAKGRQRIE